MAQTRRDFIKTSVAASVAGTIGISVPPSVLAKADEWTGQKDWKWDKTVCRFCGVGCGLMTGDGTSEVTACGSE